MPMMENNMLQGSPQGCQIAVHPDEYKMHVASASQQGPLSEPLPKWGAPSKSVLWVPPSTKARLQTPRGGSVQYPMWLASLLIAPSAHSSTRPRTDSPCIPQTSAGSAHRKRGFSVNAYGACALGLKQSMTALQSELLTGKLCGRHDRTDMVPGKSAKETPGGHAPLPR